MKHAKTKDDVLRGFMASIGPPEGRWRGFWVMRHKILVGKNKLPRGFNAGYVESAIIHDAAE